uniref:non-specific serine/threonine protein kinase n=2 Tax=Lotharella globosa TaxID=91324 RepID=A0A7S4DZX4_9EUKA
MSDTDFMKLRQNPKMEKMLLTKGNSHPAKEEVILSHMVTKINRKDKEQLRVMVVTDKAIYNLLRDSYSCKRRIPIQALGLITESTSSDEFILHVPSEYDYRYKSGQKRVIIDLLTKLFKKYMSSHDVEQRKLLTVRKPEATLGNYAITKNSRDREAILKERREAMEEVSKNDSDKEDEAKGRGGTKVTTQLIEGTDEVSAADFELLKVLGRGNFGKVMQVRRKKDQKVYAMKILKKAAIVKRDQVEYTKAERKILQSLQHPFLMTLRFAFQTSQKLYFVLDFYRGGELFFHLKNQKRFEVPLAKLYVGEVALALGHLHSLGYVYRDLKPENILLDDDGHACLTDFGLSTQVDPCNGKATTFCGTPEYLAPEIITAVGHDKAVDWWSLGILLYELTCGIPPFYSQNMHEMHHAIQFGTLKFPKWLHSETCKDLIVLLLDRDPKMRLGSKRDVEDIKEHKFFSDIDWEKLFAKKYTPAFKPKVQNHTDTRNFDREFKIEKVQETPAGPTSTLGAEGNFSGFTCDPKAKSQ